MTHEELLTKFDDLDIALSNGFGKAETIIGCIKATRAVVELHKPQEITLPDGSWGQNCKECDNNWGDCSTIKVIKSRLI